MKISKVKVNFVMSKKCIRCGAKLSVGSKVCPKCGCIQPTN